MSRPTIIARIMEFMSEDAAAIFERCWEFLKIKTAPCDEQYRKLLGKGEDKICNKIHRIRTEQPGNLCVLYGFEGQWEHAFRVLYYFFHPKNPCVSDYVSAQRYEEYKNKESKEAEVEMKEIGYECLAYYRYLGLHETELYIKKGIPACFMTKSPVRRIWEYSLNRKDPGDAEYAFEGALVLLNLNQFEMARDYINVLSSYAGKPFRPGRGAFHPKYYRAGIQFLEELYLARTSTIPESARQHAANAIAFNFQMVIDCFGNENASSLFHSTCPALALCLAVEFEFDPEWSKNCCRAMFWLVNTPYFHDVFKKAVAWDAWMWPPEKFGLLGDKEIDEIVRKARVRNFNRETGN